MITVLTGDNSFEIARAVTKIADDFSGAAERVDGSELDLSQLPDLLMGATLFAEQRLVIIKQLSDNKAVWTAFGDWLKRVSPDVHLVLVESKLDKRTGVYKDLQKAATITEYKAWTERDIAKAEQWAANEMTTIGKAIDQPSVRALVKRVGVDQWMLYQALQKLSVLDTISPDTIAEHIDANPIENVFDLFESALKGNAVKIRQMIETLALGEDPYRLFGLLSGQAFQLAALASGDDRPSTEVAKDLGVHPYGLGKLAPYARRLGRKGTRKVVAAFAEADAAMKTSTTDPWLLIERALIKTTIISAM